MSPFAGRLAIPADLAASFGSDGRILRPLRDDDGQGLVNGLNDLEVSRWTASIPHPFGAEDARAYLHRWRVREAEGSALALGIDVEGHLAGVISLQQSEDADCPSLGYWLARAFHGRGIGGAAVRAFLGFMVPACGLTDIDAAITVGNHASARILKANGFIPTGHGTCFCRAIDGEVLSETFHWQATNRS